MLPGDIRSTERKDQGVFVIRLADRLDICIYAYIYIKKDDRPLSRSERTYPPLAVAVSKNPTPR